MFLKNYVVYKADVAPPACTFAPFVSLSINSLLEGTNTNRHLIGVSLLIGSHRRWGGEAQWKLVGFINWFDGWLDVT